MEGGVTMSITSLYQRNVGGLDRGIRLVLGAPLIAAGLLAGGRWGEPFGILVALVGLVSLLTGITGRCPLYIPFEISTVRLGTTSRRASVCQHDMDHTVSRASGPVRPAAPRAGW
jgi:hypothetical protein